MGSTLVLGVLIGYLLGSIPFTQLVARLVKGIDLRKVGSHNVGGHNLTHQAGLGWGLVGGVLDGVKGLAAIAVAQWIGLSFPASLIPGAAAVIGHNWPIWLGFHGGKGLATTLGAIAWVAPIEALVAFAASILVLWRTRNILLTAVTGFSVIFLLLPVFGRPREITTFVFLLLIIVLIPSIPDILKKARTRGGIAAYMKDPSQVYREEAKKRKI